MSTKFIKQPGYFGDSNISQQLVEGCYDIPEEIDDATALILEEIGKVRVQLTNVEVVIRISPE